MCRIYKTATFKGIFNTITINLNTAILDGLETNTFPNKLKYIRLTRGLNLTELACLLNRGLTTVYNWEEGNRVPNLDTIKEISEILEIDYTYLLD